MAKTNASNSVTSERCNKGIKQKPRRNERQKLYMQKFRERQTNEVKAK